MGWIGVFWRQFHLGDIKQPLRRAAEKEREGHISEAKEIAMGVLDHFDDPYTRLEVGDFIEALYGRQMKKLAEVPELDKRVLLLQLETIFPESPEISELLASLPTSSATVLKA